uniref:Transmembrane protein 53 n=1 Tax=Plectus sambesii TaxID=2011161 RepID=A0A914V9J7_9BILA
MGYIRSRSYVITLSETCESRRGPLVFVFGWAGSKDSHIAKYSKIYEDNGLTTIRYVTPIRWLEGGVPGPDLSRPLLTAFEELQAAEREIIFHLFSMNGCIMFSSLWQALEQTPNGSKIKNQLKGIVFDSCPSHVTPWATANAVVQVKAPEEPQVAQSLRSTVLFGALFIKHVSNYIQSFWQPKVYEQNTLYYR